MKYIIYFFILILLGACGKGSLNPEKKCPMGKPIAIFSDTMAVVSDHKFEANGQEGIETVNFKNGILLELIQSGCDKLTQDFRITQQGNFEMKKDSFWINGAAQSLKLFSTYSPNLMGLNQWAMVINENKDKIKLVEPFYPQMGISITIDKITGKNETTLLLKLQQE